MEASRLLAEEYGYSIVGRVGRLDLFWIRNDILKAIGSVVPAFRTLRAPPGLHHKTASVEDVRRVLHYGVYMKTKSIEKARSAALKEMVEKHRNNPCVKPVLDKMGV
jgi:hypothetical protein